jgi:hypothetical protein
MYRLHINIVVCNLVLFLFFVLANLAKLSCGEFDCTWAPGNTSCEIVDGRVPTLVRGPPFNSHQVK